MTGAATPYKDTPTGKATSPDSGRHWTEEGAWSVSDGVYRIPLPLPLDGLRAVNVYAVATDEGLVMIDGGMAIPVARDVLERSLASVGWALGDIASFLVTHVHRDHYTMACRLGREFGARVALGRPEEPVLALQHEPGFSTVRAWGDVLVRAGAGDLVEEWVGQRQDDDSPDLQEWMYPDMWLEQDAQLAFGSRMLSAVHTPGHTPGHFVFVDGQAGLLFAGDHVLPTLSPSIGFTIPHATTALHDFMASLAKVRQLPDSLLLPAHGPIAPSVHDRVDELLVHHEDRLSASLDHVATTPLTAEEVARQLPWTRHQVEYASLDLFNQGLAASETQAHLEVLVSRGDVVQAMRTDGAALYRRPLGHADASPGIDRVLAR